MRVIDVTLLGIIRRRHLRDQASLREIAKRLGISRNTVGRYLLTEPAYAKRQSARTIDSYAFQLSGRPRQTRSNPVSRDAASSGSKRSLSI
nr:helix-turn-helix domain-containing protein [Undibacterium terreum]